MLHQECIRKEVQGMKAITLRNVPEELAEQIEREARSTNTSLNAAVIQLLRRATATGGAAKEEVRYHDLDHLAGTWTKDEADAFDRYLAEARQIHPDDWREPDNQ
jgi:hypothetical protein